MGKWDELLSIASFGKGKQKPLADEVWDPSVSVTNTEAGEKLGKIAPSPFTREGSSAAVSRKLKVLEGMGLDPYFEEDAGKYTIDTPGAVRTSMATVAEELAKRVPTEPLLKEREARTPAGDLETAFPRPTPPALGSGQMAPMAPTPKEYTTTEGRVLRKHKTERPLTAFPRPAYTPPITQQLAPMAPAAKQRGEVLAEKKGDQLVGLSAIERGEPAFKEQTARTRQMAEERHGKMTPDGKPSLFEPLLPGKTTGGGLEKYLGGKGEQTFSAPMADDESSRKRFLSEQFMSETVAKAPIDAIVSWYEFVRPALPGAPPAKEMLNIVGANVTPAGVSEESFGTVGRTVRETPLLLGERVVDFVKYLADPKSRPLYDLGKRMNIEGLDKPADEDYLKRGIMGAPSEVAGLPLAMWHQGKMAYDYFADDAPTKEKQDALFENLKAMGGEMGHSFLKTAYNPKRSIQDQLVASVLNVAFPREWAVEKGRVRVAKNIGKAAGLGRATSLPELMQLRRGAIGAQGSLGAKARLAPHERTMWSSVNDADITKAIASEEAMLQTLTKTRGRLVAEHRKGAGAQLRSELSQTLAKAEPDMKLRLVEARTKYADSARPHKEFMAVNTQMREAASQKITTLRLEQARRQVNRLDEAIDATVSSREAIDLAAAISGSPSAAARLVFRRHEATHGRGSSRWLSTSPTDRLPAEFQAYRRNTAGELRQFSIDMNDAVLSVPYRHRPVVSRYLHMEHAPVFSNAVERNLVEFSPEAVAPNGNHGAWRTTKAFEKADPKVKAQVVTEMALANTYGAGIAQLVQGLTKKGIDLGMYYAPEKLLSLYWPNLWKRNKGILSSIRERYAPSAVATERRAATTKAVGGGVPESRKVAGRLAEEPHGNRLLANTMREKSRQHIEAHPSADAPPSFDYFKRHRGKTDAEIGRIAARAGENPWRIEGREMRGMSKNLMQEAMEGVGELAWDTSLYSLYRQVAKDKRLALTANEWRALPAELQEAYIPVTTKRLRPIEGSPAKYGDLAGKYVQEDVILEMANAHKMRAEAVMGLRRMTRLWKSGKTAWSPSTTARNLLTNVFLFAPMADLSILNPLNLKYYSMAVKDLLAPSRLKSRQFRQAWKDGALEGTMGRTELTSYGELAPFRGATGSAEQFVGALFDTMEQLTTGTRASRMKAGAKAPLKLARGISEEVMATPGRLYGALDDVFRLAYYYKNTGAGRFGRAARMRKPLMTGEQAAAGARKYFIDYENVAGWVNTVRNPYSRVKMGNEGALLENQTRGWTRAGWSVFGQPFIAFTARAVPMMEQWMMQHPLKAQLWLSLHEQMMHAQLIESGEDAEAMGAFSDMLPGYLRGKYIPAAAIDPRLARMGKEATASGPEWAVGLFNAAFLNPFGQVTPEPEPGAGAIASTLRFFDQHVGGSTPIGGLALDLAANRNAFTGRPIFSEQGDERDVLRQALGHVYMQAMPPSAPSLTADRPLEQWAAPFLPNVVQRGLKAVKNPLAAPLRGALGGDLPGGYQSEKLTRAMKGEADYRGRVREPWLAYLDVFGGVRMESYAPTRALANASRQFVKAFKEVGELELAGRQERAIQGTDEHQEWKEAVAVRMIPKVMKFRRTIRGAAPSKRDGLMGAEYDAVRWQEFTDAIDDFAEDAGKYLMSKNSPLLQSRWQIDAATLADRLGLIKDDMNALVSDQVSAEKGAVQEAYSP